MPFYGSHQRRAIYYYGPPRNSSLSLKVKRFAFKAVLRCKGGDLSDVVDSASRRPRTFVLLSVGRVAHSLQSNEKSLYLQKCQLLWIRDLQTR